MANIILMPQLGISEESAILTVWYVKQGDIVRAGDKLFSIETGKSSFDVESGAGGTVLALYASEGDEVAVKAPVCAIGEPGEEVVVPELPAEPKAQATPAVSPQEKRPAAPLCVTGQRGVSPRARNLAQKLGVDLTLAVPTGPEGRVIERDVRQLTDTVAQGAPAAYEDKPLSNMRKIIAQNMMASLQNTAQLTHTASFDATDILACRKRFKADPAMNGVTLTDMVLFAVSRTLPDFPALNAWLLDETLRVFSDVNLAVAVDTGRGLMAPVIFGASALTLPALSGQAKTLAEGCRSGSADPALLTGGSFTVSNLGAFGIESFTPILNAPQTGILGVCAITQRVTGPVMTLSLTYDHRAIDGAPASRFLQTLCKYLEKFSENMV